MSKKSRKEWLTQAASQPQSQTLIIDPRVAFQESLLFAFSYFSDCRGDFESTKVEVDALVRVIDAFRLFSQVNRNQIHTHYKHCHEIEEKEVKKYSLQDLIDRSPTNKIFQLGRRAHPERIIGFYEHKQPNIFQVCFFDIYHQIYPDH